MGFMDLMGLMGRLAVAALLTGCLTSWVVCFLEKWKVGPKEDDPSVMMWLQIHGNKFVSGVAYCHFCANWWLSWCVVVVALVVTGEWWLVGVPFFSTTIGRFLSA